MLPKTTCTLTKYTITSGELEYPVETSEVVIQGDRRIVSIPGSKATQIFGEEQKNLKIQYLMYGEPDDPAVFGDLDEPGVRYELEFEMYGSPKKATLKTFLPYTLPGLNKSFELYFQSNNS